MTHLEQPLTGWDLYNHWKAMGLRTRTVGCLTNNGVTSLNHLATFTERALRKWPNLGDKSLDEIKHLLARHGLKLAYPVPISGPQVDDVIARFEAKVARRVVECEQAAERLERAKRDLADYLALVGRTPTDKQP